MWTETHTPACASLPILQLRKQVQRGEMTHSESRRINGGRDQSSRPYTVLLEHLFMASSVPGRAWGEPHMALPLQDLMGHMKPAEVTDSNTDGDTAKSLLTIVSWKSLGIIQPNPCSLTGDSEARGMEPSPRSDRRQQRSPN